MNFIISANYWVEFTGLGKLRQVARVFIELWCVRLSFNLTTLSSLPYHFGCFGAETFGTQAVLFEHFVCHAVRLGGKCNQKVLWADVAVAEFARNLVGALQYAFNTRADTHLIFSSSLLTFWRISINITFNITRFQFVLIEDFSNDVVVGEGIKQVLSIYFPPAELVRHITGFLDNILGSVG